MGAQTLTTRPGFTGSGSSSSSSLALAEGHGGQAHLESCKNSCKEGRQAQDFAPQPSARHYAPLPSRAPADLTGVHNFGASGAVRRAVRPSFSQTNSPVETPLPLSQNDPEQRGRPHTAVDDLSPHRPRPLRPGPASAQESSGPSAQSISSGKPGKRGHARTIALPQEATGRAARLV